VAAWGVLQQMLDLFTVKCLAGDGGCCFKSHLPIDMDNTRMQSSGRGRNGSFSCYAKMGAHAHGYTSTAHGTKPNPMTCMLSKLRDGETW
jgi:hypothetical protein